MVTETVELQPAEVISETVLAKPPETGSKRRRALELLLVMSVAFAPLLFSSTVAYFLNSANRFSKLGAASLILHESIALAVLAYVLSQQRRTLQEIGLQFKISDFAIGLLLLVGAFAAAALSQSLVYVWNQSAGALEMPARNPVTVGALGVVGLVFVALNPVFEELLVRGYFTTELAVLTRSRWIPTAASVLLQGSYHLYQGIPAALAVTACFLVWALYFNRTRRLGPVIVAHFYADAYALLRST